jgi:hypothetical protein
MPSLGRTRPVLIRNVTHPAASVLALNAFRSSLGPPLSLILRGLALHGEKRKTAIFGNTRHAARGTARQQERSCGHPSACDGGHMHYLFNLGHETVRITPTGVRNTA